MTRIRINKARFFAYHGVFEYEKQFGNEFELDIDMKCDIPELTGKDDLNLTVNYREVYNLVNDVFTSEKYNLIETLSEKIGNEILKNFDKVKSVKISIRKPNAPLGVIDSVEIIKKYSR